MTIAGIALLIAVAVLIVARSSPRSENDPSDDAAQSYWTDEEWREILAEQKRVNENYLMMCMPDLWRERRVKESAEKAASRLCVEFSQAGQRLNVGEQ